MISPQRYKEMDKIRRRFLWAGDGEITGGSARLLGLMWLDQFKWGGARYIGPGEVQ